MKATSCSPCPSLRRGQGWGEGILRDAQAAFNHFVLSEHGHERQDTTHSLKRRDRENAATNSKGFSLVEMVIVIMIISIMSAVAVPKFADAYMYHKVESAARRIKADLELTRRAAMAKSQSYTLEFLTGLKYQLTNIASADHAGQDVIVDLAQSPYEITTVTVDFGGETDVTFNGHGIADSDGQITIQAGGYSRQINLDAPSGVVTIQ